MDIGPMDAVVRSEMGTAYAQARTPTDGEVAEFRANGWVKLERFIDPAHAATLLSVAEQTMGERPGAEEDLPPGDTSTVSRGGKVVNASFFQDYHFIARDDHIEPFRSLAFSREIGRAAQRLMRRDVAVRYHNDLVACKMPSGSEGGNQTTWHQDFPALPFDRYGTLAFWIALTDLTPEHGTMRFLEGSHREGPLGRLLPSGTDVLEAYPALHEEYPLSGPISLRAGDATAHHAGVIHGAPENTTDEPRWAFICAYFPADTLYNGAGNYNFNNLGLEMNRPLEHPNFPVVYP